MKCAGYLRDFLEYWTPRAEIGKVWFSLFTPQVGDRLPEILQPDERRQAIVDMLALRKEFPKLDMPGRHDSAVRHAPASSRGLCFCAHYPAICGPGNQNRSLSIRGKSGLRFVRMRRIHGSGGHSGAQARRHRPRRSHLQNLDQNWADGPRAVPTECRAASRRAKTPGASPRKEKYGGRYAQENGSDSPG